MDQNRTDHEYEFLDLSDVDDNERTRLSSALLQLSDKNAPASLNDDAVQAQCRTTDDECRLPCNIQSNSIANSSWPNQIANVANNLEEASQVDRHSNTSLTQRECPESNNQMPRMSPHTNTSRPVQSPPNQSVPLATHHGPAHSPAHVQSQQTQQSPLQAGQLTPQQQQHHGQQANGNNIPPHSLQAQVYQQHPQQPLAIHTNYLQHGGGHGHGPMYAIPNLIFSNFTANVNVQGYTHAMQPSYISPNAQPFVPADQQIANDQSQIAIQPTQHVRSGPGRRGRGRSNSGGHRREYGSRNLSGVQEIGQMQPSPSHSHSHSHQHPHSHNIEQQMMSNSPNYGGGGQFYVHHPYSYGNQMPLSPHATAAQHVAGPPLYVNNPQFVYQPYYQHGGMMYPTAMVAPPDMAYSIDEKGEEQMAQENAPAVMSPVWMEYQPMENQMNSPAEEFMQQPPPDEYGAQHPEEYIQQPPNEFMQPPPHQQPNEFIPQQVNEYHQGQQPPLPAESEDFAHQHQPDGQGFIYGPPSIEHPTPLPMNQVYKPNYTPEFIPQPPLQQHQHQQQPPPHHHATLPVEFLHPTHNDQIHRDAENTMTFNAYSSNDKEIQYDGHLMEGTSSDNNINYADAVVPTHRPHTSPITIENVECGFQFMQSSDINIQTNAIDLGNQQQQHPQQQQQSPQTQQEPAQYQHQSSHLQQQPLQHQHHQQHQQQQYQQHQQHLQQQEHEQQQQVPQTVVLAPAPPQPVNHIEHELIENVLVQQTVEKLNVNVEVTHDNQSRANVWTNRKSTQSVAISAVPSNNCMQLEQTAEPVQFVASVESGLSNKVNLDVNNSNTSLVINNNKPIVPKADEKVSINAAQKSAMAPEPRVHEPKTQSTIPPPPPPVATVTSQSFEMQTMPVEPNQKFNQSEFLPLGARPKDSAAAASAEKANAVPSSWASLFNKPGRSSSINRQIEPQRKSIQKVTGTESQGGKPVAKIPPNNTKEDNNDVNKSTVPSVVSSVAYSSNVVTNLSYSAASTQNLPPQATPSIAKKTPTAKATVNPSPKPASQSASNESSLRLGEFFQKYKVNNESINLRPRGLTNRSNYCYINAILQALVACPPFYNLMKSIPLDQPSLRFKTNTPTIDAMVELIREFSTLPEGSKLQRRDRGNKKEDVGSELACDPSFEPLAIHKLWNATRVDNEGSQEDAEEFLSYVLNKLNDEMLELKKLVDKPAAVTSPPALETASNGLEFNGETADDDEEWQVMGTRNKSSITRPADFGRTPLSDIFRGELRSRVIREGSLASPTDIMQPFFTLQLNIEKAANVREALENFVNKDEVEGFTCAKTNQKVNAWQTMTLEKLPVVLVLHLKWFDYKADGCTKILKTVEYPIDLKLDAKILSSKKYKSNQKQYRLFAVVYHDGKDATKGHYITDVYHSGSWLRYDDSSVKRVPERHVLHPNAPRVPYLLYYRRLDTLQANSSNTTATTATTSAHIKS